MLRFAWLWMLPAREGLMDSVSSIMDLGLRREVEASSASQGLLKSREGRLVGETDLSSERCL